MSTKRYREKFTFWLNLTNNSEYEIAEQITELKRKRSFSKTIRDGIRLIYDLRQGNTTVLVELFPWVKENLKPQETTGEKVLREQLERLERLLIEQGNKPIALPATTSLSETLLDEDLPSVFVQDVIADPAEARSNFANSMGDLFADDSDDLWDDEDDATLITTNKDTKIDSTQNAINSLSSANP
jgi:hypothetical protein